MKSFIKFIFEAKTPEELARIKQAKVDTYVGRYMKHHADHPLVQSNPKRAKELIAASQPLQNSHEEAAFVSKNFLNGTLHPGEDEPTVQYSLKRYRSAKKRGKTSESLLNHTHDSLMKHLNEVDPVEDSNSTYPDLSDMNHFNIGQIFHPSHGRLRVFHIHKDNVEQHYPDNSTEGFRNLEGFSDISRRFKRQSCDKNNFCVFNVNGYGPDHLKHYSHGHGMLFYVNDKNKIVFGHGFGDRGIVNPDNSVVDDAEDKIIRQQTSKLLPPKQKEVYDFMTGSDASLETQERMLKEFGPTHGVAHFLDPNVNTHPKILQKMAEEPNMFDNNEPEYAHHRIDEHAYAHPNIPTEMRQKALIPYFSTNRQKRKFVGAIRNPKTTDLDIERILSDKNTSLGHFQAIYNNYPKLKSHHLDNMLARDSRLLPDLFSRYDSSNNPIEQSTAITEKHINMYLDTFMTNNSSGRYFSTSVFQHPNFSKGNYEKAIKSERSEIRSHAAISKFATPEALDNVISDKKINRFFRIRAAMHPNLSHESILKAMDDEDLHYDPYDQDDGNGIFKNPNINSEHLSHAFSKSKYNMSGFYALDHPKIEEHHIDQAIRHGVPHKIQRKAVKHPKAKLHHLFKILQNPSIGKSLAHELVSLNPNYYPEIEDEIMKGTANYTDTNGRNVTLINGTALNNLMDKHGDKMRIENLQKISKTGLHGYSMEHGIGIIYGGYHDKKAQNILSKRLPEQPKIQAESLKATIINILYT